jgi:hypothetical protein
MSLSEPQIERLDELIAVPWGSVEPAIDDVKDGLRLLMRLTHAEFVAWESKFDGDFFDEYSAPIDEARRMPSEWRLAHIRPPGSQYCNGLRN